MIELDNELDDSIVESAVRDSAEVVDAALRDRLKAIEDELAALKERVEHFNKRSPHRL